MEQCCFICEEKANVEQLGDVRCYATLLYNFTSVQVSEISGHESMKVCGICTNKLLEFERFRELCISVLTRMTKNAEEQFVPSPSFVKIEENVNYEDEPTDDCDVPEANVECEPEYSLRSVDQPTSVEERKGIEETNEMEERADSDDADENSDEPSARQQSTKDNQPTLECQLCGHKFRNQNRYEGHLRVHQGLKPALCKLCGKEFMKWHNYKMHMLHKHSDADRTMYQCDFEGCDMAYATKAGMLLHRKKHDPEYVTPTPTPCVCETCGKTFTTVGALKKHSFIHTGNMPFHCTVCDKRYPTAHKLKEHTMRHQGIKNYVCPYCGLKKTTINELKLHMNYHTKEKTFACASCDHVFLNSGNLARHVKIVHQKIKLFDCPFCSRSFAKSETLKNHIMTHTGERPHGCPVCSKRFIQLVALHSHLKKHAKKGEGVNELQEGGNRTE